MNRKQWLKNKPRPASIIPKSDIKAEEHRPPDYGYIVRNDGTIRHTPWGEIQTSMGNTSWTTPDGQLYTMNGAGEVVDRIGRRCRFTDHGTVEFYEENNNNES